MCIFESNITTVENTPISEVHQTNHSRICEFSGPTRFTTQEFSIVDSYLHEGPQKTVRIGEWALARGWALAQNNTVVICNHRLDFTASLIPNTSLVGVFIIIMFSSVSCDRLIAAYKAKSYTSESRRHT